MAANVLSIGFRITADNRDFIGAIQLSEQELARLRNALNNTDRANGRVTRSTNLLSRAFQELKGALAVVGLASATKEIVDAAVAADRLNSAMTSATGGIVDATKEMSFVREEADKLGISFDAAAKGFIKIAANAEGTILEGKATEEIFNGLSVAASALRMSGDDLNGMLLAVGQMMSKGTVMSEELKLQIGERLPGSFAVAAEAMGVTTAELTDMMKKGEVITNDFLPKFAALLAQKYGAGAENAAKGLSANLARLDNEWTQLMRDFGTANTGVIDSVVNKLRGLLSVVRNVGQGLGIVSRAPLDALENTLQLEQRILVDRKTIYAQVSASQGAMSAAAVNLRAQIDQSKDKISELVQKLHELRSGASEASTALANQHGIDTFISQMTAVYTAYGKAKTAIEQQIEAIGKSERSLFVLSNTQKLDAQITGTQRDELSKLYGKLYDTQKAFEDNQKAIADHKKAVEDHKKALEKQAKALQEVLDKLPQLDSATAQYIKDVNTLDKSLKNHLLSEAQYNEAITQLGENYQRAISTTHNYRQDIDSLRASMDENYRKTLQMAEAKDMLTQAIAAGNITVEAADALYQQYSKHLDELSQKKVPKVQQTFESFGSRLTTLFQNTFQTILTSGQKKFSDLAKDILNMFTQIFFELASRKIVASMGFQGTGVGGDLASSGSSGGFLNSLMGMFGMGSAASSAGSADFGFGSMQGMGMLGGSGAGLSSMAAGGVVGASLILGPMIGKGLSSLLGFKGENAQTGAAIAGMLSGGILGPLGGWIGSFFDHPPPSNSTIGTYDLSTGTSNLMQSHDESKQAYTDVMSYVKELDQAVRSTTGLKSGATVYLDYSAASGDGMQVDLRNFKGDDGKLHNRSGKFGDNLDAAEEFAIKNLIDSYEGLNKEAVTLIKAFQGNARALMDYTQLVLGLSAQLPQLDAIFGSNNLKTYVDTANLFGGGDAFNAAVSTFAQRFGYSDDVVAAQLAGEKGTMHAELKALGTNRTNFAQDFDAAKAAGLTPEQMKAWIDAGNEIIKVEGLESQLAQLRGTVTVDSLQGLEDAFTNLNEVLNGTANQNQTLLQSYNAQASTVMSLANAYDGSDVATQKLTAATNDFAQTALQVMQQISEARSNISETTSGSIEGIKLSTMGDKEKYDYFQSQAQALENSLSSMSDPAQIEATVQKINDLTNKAYALIPDDQKKAFSQQFIDFLTDTAHIADSKLNDTEKDVKKTGADVAGETTKKLEDILPDFGQTMSQAAIDFKNAVADLQGVAATMQRAANTPVNVTITQKTTAVGYSY